MSNINNVIGLNLLALNNTQTLKSKNTDVLIKIDFSPAELGINPRKAPKTVTLTDDQIEKKLFAKYGLNAEDAKSRLKADNPFDRVNTNGDNVFTYNSKTGKYEKTYSLEGSLHRQLSGTAKEIKKQIE